MAATICGRERRNDKESSSFTAFVSRGSMPIDKRAAPRLKIFLPKPMDRSGGSSIFQRVNNKEVIRIGDFTQQAQPRDAAVNNPDICRQIIAVRKRLDCTDADAVVAHENVADAENQDPLLRHQALRVFTL
jgi:hypothetical protein